MLIYEYKGQLGAIYDGENENLLPDDSKLLKRVEISSEGLNEVKECTLGELDRVLSQYL